MSCLQLLLLIVLFIMRKRIKLVTALFREAGRAIQDMPFLLIQPMIVSTQKVASYVRVIPDIDLCFLIWIRVRLLKLCNVSK